MGAFPDELEIVPVHNSDIQSFKSCRERWNWLSDLREGYKPVDTPTPLYFGTAVHAGEEVYYSPGTWHMVLEGGAKREAVIMAAIIAFVDSMNFYRARYLKATGQEALDGEIKERFMEHMDLGKGMLLHYFEWVQKHDLDIGLTPVAVEVPFEYPIFESYVHQLDRVPGSVGKKIVFRGRIDLLVRDKDGRLWILDHKTTTRMPDRLLFLEMDEQMGSYILGYTLGTGEQIAGAIYNEILKGFPLPPEELKVVRLGRRFSVSKNQYTSYDVYKKKLIEENEPLELYEDFLQWLKSFGTTYVRRTPIPRNTNELRNLGFRIELEVADMLNHPNIYPSPGRWACDHCPCSNACLAKMEGQDFQWILDAYFIKEKRTNA